MLPPFRVRGLGRSTPTVTLASNNSTLVPNDDTLLRMTAPQYDSIISDHPDAKLRYVDDDDGEIVTVATSLELSQRLEEPPSQRLHPQQCHHVFDVDRKEASIKVWQSLAEQGGKLGSVGGPIAPECGHSILCQNPSRPLGQNAPSISAPTAVAQDVEVDHIPIESEVEDYRQQYIDACGPPQVITQDATPPFLRRFDPAKHTSRSISKSGTNPRTLSLVAGATSLTPEGQRQAQAAGDRMRASRYLRRTMAAPETLPLNYQNRWASYNRSTPCFSIDDKLNFIDPLAGSSSRRQAQAAADVMRSRNSRIRQSKSKSDVRNPETIDTGDLANCGRRTVNFDVLNDDAANTSKSSATESPMRNMQSENLLEVFESEFSKQGDLVGMAPEQNLSSPNFDISAAAMQTQNATPSMLSEGRYSEGPRIEMPLPNTSPGQQALSSIKKSVEDIASVILRLRTQADSSEANLLAQQMALTLEKALDCALCEFKICLTKIAESAKDATKMGCSEIHNHRNQQTEDPLKTSQSYSHKANASARICPYPQFSPAKGSNTKSCKMSPEPLRKSPNEKSLNATSDLNWSSSRSCGSGRIELSSPKADSPKSELKSFNSEFISEAAAKAGLHEPKTTQGLDVASPFNHESPVAKNHTATNHKFRSGIPSCDSLAPDHERSTILTDQYRPISLASGFCEKYGDHSQTFPSLPAMKPLLPSQNVQYLGGNAVTNSSSSTSSDTTKSLPNRTSFSKTPLSNRPNPIAKQRDAEPPFFLTDSVSHNSPKYEDRSPDHVSHRMTCLDVDEAQIDPSVGPALHREPPQTLDGLRRSATVAGLNDKYTGSSRRPYTTNFDDSGGMPWSSFVQHRPARVEGSSANNVHSMSSRPDSLQLEAQNPHTSASFSQDIYAAEHSDVTTASKVQQCVEQLRKLGFGSDADGSVHRLVVYAQAADGDLVEAIDMIDEEQRAYRQK